MPLSKSVTYVLVLAVTYVVELFCYLCPGCAPLPVPREIHDDVQNFANLLQGDASVRTSLVSSFHSLYPQLNVTLETLDELASIIREKFPLSE